MRGSWNPWGHAWDRWGRSFATDGAGSQGVMYVFPGATFEPAPGASRFLPGLNPGSPKLCGLEIVSGRHLPDEWQGSLITCDVLSSSCLSIRRQRKTRGLKPSRRPT